MWPINVTPLLLIVLMGLVLGLVAWGFWRAQSHETGDVLMRTHNDVLLWLLVLAAFALGVFFAYILLGFSS